MSPPKKANAKQPVSLRFTPDISGLIDQAATKRGMTRQEWFDRLVERGLQGEGLLPKPDRSESVGAARAERRQQHDPEVCGLGPGHIGLCNKAKAMRLTRTDVTPILKAGKKP